MILRKTVLAAGALVALLASASVGSAKPAAPAKSGAAAPVQCSTKLLTLRPHYPDPVKPIAGAAGSLSGAGSTFVAPIMSMWAQAYSKKGTNVAYQGIGSGGGVSQINAQTVDFGASDTPMLDTELAAAKGGPILHIPLVLGAVTVVLPRQGRRVGPQLRRRDDRQDLRRRDHELERPGDQEAQSQGEPARRGHRGRPPL